MRKPFQIQTSSTLAYNFVLLELLKNPLLTEVIIVLSFQFQLTNVMPSSLYLSHRNQFPVKNLYKNTALSTVVVKF